MKFHLLAFLSAFAIGMLIVYLFTPFPDVVIRYPRPNDFHSLRFMKKNGTCMQYSMKQVSCGTDNTISISE
jgi:hypothetical protein